MPKSSDPYRWKLISDEDETLSKLFSKNISDHSIRAYKALCEGVDNTFEAVPLTPSKTNGPDFKTSVCNGKYSWFGDISDFMDSYKGEKSASVQRFNA